MGWFNEKRFEDNLESNKQLFDAIEHRYNGLEEQIRRHDERTFDEFQRIEDSINNRHSENRRWLMGILAAIIAGLVLNYLANHGFMPPKF